MGHYEDKKLELESLLSQYKEVQFSLEQAIRKFAQEEKNISKRREDIKKWVRDQKEIIRKLAEERQIGLPYLGKAYEEYFKLQDKNIVDFLKYKHHPAVASSEIIKECLRLRRKAVKEKKIAEYLVEYYETIAPFLLDLKEEVDIPTDEEVKLLKEYSEEELEDRATNYLTKEEYRKLPSVERNQMALERFWKRRKSKWLIGRLYERYVGYLYEEKDYDVEYVGIFKGFEDLGRDLICKKGKNFIVIQCKNWAKFRTIYEKHIFQFFGTVFKYRDENPDKKTKAIFYTSTKLSDLARRFAKELNIELKEDFKFDRNYPCIKCNISRVDKEKIYHLPFDQQYDTTKIEKNRGEFYCKTVKEAEDAGFRRAFRWKGDKKDKTR